MLTVVALVLLRVAIGWHFLYEGLWKKDVVPAFSSEGYWRAAKGPLAPLYQRMLLPDLYGEKRLDAELVFERWQAEFDRYVAKYRLSEEQRVEAEAILQRHRRVLEDFLAANLETYTTTNAEGEEVERPVYLADLERLRSRQRNESLSEMPFGRRRLWDEQRKLLGQSAPWIAQVEAIEQDLYDALGAILDTSQKARGEWQRPAKLLDRLDGVVIWYNIVIGACLIAGLFTRLAAVSAALFLATLIGAQPEWPTIYPPAPASAGHALLVNKEFVEMMALFALATTRVGRWGGLDFFVHYLLVRPLFGGKKRHASDA
mgnify:CR=1 FL=1